MIDWGSILTGFLATALSAFAVVLVKVGMAYVQAKLAEVKASEPSVGTFLEMAADFAVKAAEQSGLSGFIQDKKIFAIATAQHWLEAQGIKGIDLSLLDAAIEKAVIELFPHDTPGSEKS